MLRFYVSFVVDYFCNFSPLRRRNVSTDYTNKDLRYSVEDRRTLGRLAYRTLGRLAYRFLVQKIALQAAVYLTMQRQKPRCKSPVKGRNVEGEAEGKGKIRNTTDAEECVVPYTEEAVDRISIDIGHSTVQQGKNILDFVTVLAYPSLPSAISLSLSQSICE